MVAVVGTYQNGYVKLDKNFSTKEPVKVIVTFLEDVENTSDKGLSLSDFSFSESQANLENYKGSLGETVVDERRRDL